MISCWLLSSVSISSCAASVDPFQSLGRRRDRASLRLEVCNVRLHRQKSVLCLDEAEQFAISVSNVLLVFRLDLLLVLHVVEIGLLAELEAPFVLLLGAANTARDHCVRLFRVALLCEVVLTAQVEHVTLRGTLARLCAAFNLCSGDWIREITLVSNH